MNHSLQRLLCLIGLLGSAACTGTIDNNKDQSSLRPAPGNGVGTAPGQQPPATSGNTPARGTDGASEGTTPVGGISGGSSSSSGARRGGARARDPQRADAGEDEDELEVDAGGVEVDAGGVDAGGVDAGPGGDASAAPL